jgi:hypothetical protein
MAGKRRSNTEEKRKAGLATVGWASALRRRGTESGRAEGVGDVFINVREVESYRVEIFAKQGGKLVCGVEDLDGETFCREQEPRLPVRATDCSQGGMCGIEGAFDGEQGRVGEGDDERLGRGVDVVGGGIGIRGPW